VIVPMGTILDISFLMKDDTPNKKRIFLEHKKASKTFQIFTIKIIIIPQRVPTLGGGGGGQCR
jgi:hypothetical protein